MEEWKFLLQKDGDRSWLPLDSPDVEILEGRYRIVAQTNHNNTDIHIRICHLATEEDPPKRRIQKRSNRSNTNGLMVVIPFTYLQAGLWEFSCFLADPMSDLVGDTLHHAIRLQVSACVTADEEVWEEPQSPSTVDHPTDLQAKQLSEAEEEMQWVASSAEPELVAHEATPATQDLAALNLEIAEALGLSMDRLVEMTDQLSHQLVEEIFKEFNFVPYTIAPKVSVEDASAIETTAVETVDASLSVPASENSAPESETIAVKPAVPAAALQLVLAQEIWIARQGETLTVSGQIEIDQQFNPDNLEAYPLAIASGEAAELTASSIAATSVVDLADAEPKEIHLRLRDPQTSQVVFTACQSYPAGELPLPFSFLCRLPEDLTTHLVLGEMLLCGTLPGAENALITLKSFNFTVTVDPEGLVEELQKVKTAMLESTSLENLPDFVTEFSTKLLQEQAKRKLDLSFLNLATTVSVQTDQAEQPVVKASSRMVRKPSKQIFPPQIYEPSQVEANKRKVELPAFATVGASQTSDSAIAQLEADNEDSPEFAFATSTMELESMLATEPTHRGNGLTALQSPPGSSYTHTSPESISENHLEVEERGSHERDFSSPDNEKELAEDLLTTDDRPEEAGQDKASEDVIRFNEIASPIKTEFQALNLQERFLSRLTSLATDAELLMFLKPPSPETDAEQPDTPSEAETQAENPLEAEIHLDVENAPQSDSTTLEPTIVDVASTEIVQEPTTEEVVVDDDPTWREWVKRAGVRMKKIEPEQTPDQDSMTQAVKKSLILPLEQPVPMPIVELVNSKAIAGRPIGVRVKLANGPSKVYVKLWVNDRQTRAMLDGPRWLVDFLPNGFDELETNTQITAPFGSVEVRLEAIAVEMHSQRESQKVSIDCEVLPPDVPDELFDEFELI